MTTETTEASAPPRRLLRSVGAILAGFVVVVVLSIATDQLFHAIGVYPSMGEPMHDPGLNILSLGYRIAYTILGGYIAARLAPRNPMRHALILGGVGLVIGLLSAIATISNGLLPVWFMIALVIIALPCAWFGGVLHRSRRPEARET